MNTFAWALCIGLAVLCGVIYMVGTYNLDSTRFETEQFIKRKNDTLAQFTQSEESDMEALRRTFQSKVQDNRQLDQDLAQKQQDARTLTAKAGALKESEADLDEMRKICEQIRQLQENIDALNARIRMMQGS